MYETPPALVETEARRDAVAQVVTLENALWLLLGVAALGLRLVSLARWPLAEQEAALAYEAWRFVSGLPYDLGAAAASPLVFNLNALVFALFGASDGAARAAQAVAGTGLVLAPWLLRPLLGRGEALAMSFLLLLSPSLLFWSRQASGEIWGALFALLLVAGTARWLRWGASWDGLLAAFALGLGLASGPSFWSVLAAGALLLAWERWRPQRPTEGEDTPPLPDALPLPPLSYGIVALVAFVLAATGFLTNLQGLGAALMLPIQWITRLFGAGSALVLPFFLVLLLYESLAVLVGVMGAVRLTERAPRWAAFGLLWAGITLLPATLTNSGWAAGMVVIVVPAALLASALVADIGRRVAAEGTVGVDGLLMVLGLGMLVYFWINLSSYLSAPQAVKLVSMAVPVVALGLTSFLLALSYGNEAARRGLGLTILMLLAIVSLSSAWGLSVVRGADPREPLVVQPSDPNLRTGAAQLAQISIERYRDPAAIPLGIERNLGYAPRWYFRNFKTMTLVDGPSPSVPEAALLASEFAPRPGDIGQRIWLRQRWEWPLAQAPATDLVRWLKLREHRQGLVTDSAVLFVSLP